MDRSPIDLEALARMANELFRGGEGDTGVPGPASIPSALQAAPAATDQGLASSFGSLPNVPVGGATFSPSAPPTRPVFGRAVSAESPVIGYGSGQPRTGTAPVPAAQGLNASPPLGFDPQSIPGLAPIPHLAQGFDVGTLLGGAMPDVLKAAPGADGFDPVAFGLPSGPSSLPSEAQAVPQTFDVFSAQTPGVSPTGVPAGGATLSPSSPPNRPSFGHAVSPESPIVGYGSGQPRTGTTPAPGGSQLPGVDVADYSTQFPGLDRPESLLPQAFGRFDPAGVGKAASAYLASNHQPGFAVPGAPAGYGSIPDISSRRATPTQPPSGIPRSIDRPTPNAFAFTDAPHLGEFDEEAILRRALDPQHGAPAIEGLRERPTSLPDPTAHKLAPSATPSFYFLDDRMDYFGDDVPKVPRPAATPFNADAVRRDFPVLHQTVHGHPLVWLDNGATTQKPQVVIDAVARFYENDNSNISRSAHELAVRATNAYEDARKTVQRFINASEFEEIVFVRGTTEAINLVAQSFGRRFIKEGDEILLTHAEHHANIVPWYNLAKEVGAHLKVVPFDDNGEIMLDEYEQLLNHRVKIVATTHVANALGTILPVKAMTEMAHRHGIPVLVDGAQSISHMPIDVQDIDCDFYVFSGHKVFAPTGIGAVYGKKALLDQMPPWQGGGNMIKDVTFEKITFQPPPFRFEAGTGNIADAIGLAEALKYIERLGMTNIEQYEHTLLDYATQKLRPIKGLTIIGNAREKAGVISFLLEGKEPVEVGKALNEKGIAVRAGHHCALPILRRYGVEATVRPAFAMYNTFEDADRLAAAVREIAASS